MLARFLLLIACLAAFAVPPSAGARTPPPSREHAHYFRTKPTGAEHAPAPSSRNLVYQGGHIGTGIQPRPRVYISFYGRQWGTARTSSGNLVFSNDPAGLAPVLQRFLRGLYSTDTWSTSTTQFCDGVSAGTTQCGGAGRHVGHS
jgi:serine protease